MESSPQTKTRSRGGFTLIEILASLGLVIVLAALLIATLGNMQTKANLSQSVSNLRHVGVALLQYAADHEMELPNKAESHKPNVVSRQLMDPYLPYLDKIWICPVIRSLQQTGVSKNDQGRFIYNWRLTNFSDGWRDNVPGIRLTAIQKPTEALLAANLSSGMRGGYGDGYANVLFADGGVRRIADGSHLGGKVTSMDCVNRNYLLTSGGKVRGYDY